MASSWLGKHLPKMHLQSIEIGRRSARELLPISASVNKDNITYMFTQSKKDRRSNQAGALLAWDAAIN